MTEVAKDNTNNAASVKSASKTGRNRDGTIAKGHNLGTKSPGRPPEVLSVRSQTKIRVSKDPALLDKALDGMFHILADPEHPQFAKMLETFIKLNGNFDPVETRDVTPLRDDNPYKQFSRDELKQLLKGKL